MSRGGALPTEPARLAVGLERGSVLRESRPTASARLLAIRPVPRLRRAALVPPRRPSRAVNVRGGRLRQTNFQHANLTPAPAWNQSGRPNGAPKRAASADMLTISQAARKKISKNFSKLRARIGTIFAVTPSAKRYL